MFLSGEEPELEFFIHVAFIIHILSSVGCCWKIAFIHTTVCSRGLGVVGAFIHTTGTVCRLGVVGAPSNIRQLFQVRTVLLGQTASPQVRVLQSPATFRFGSSILDPATLLLSDERELGFLHAYMDSGAIFRDFAEGDVACSLLNYFLRNSPVAPGGQQVRKLEFQNADSL